VANFLFTMLTGRGDNVCAYTGTVTAQINVGKSRDAPRVRPRERIERQT
jgi:hypothetical protein